MDATRLELTLCMAVVLAVFRMMGDKSEMLQAIAHIYMGWGLKSWWVNHEMVWKWVVIILSVVEVGSFLAFRGVD